MTHSRHRSTHFTQSGVNPMSSIRGQILVLAVSASLACGDGGGPDNTDLHFSGTVDNAPWVEDTAVAIAFGALTDTTLSLTAVRTVSSAEEQGITLSVHGFTGKGQVPLADTNSIAVAAFTVSQISGGVLVSSIVYRTHASPAGSLTITSIDRADSTVAGRFAFEAALTPDTAPHRHVSGTFRLRLGFVPVYTIP